MLQSSEEVIFWPLPRFIRLKKCVRRRYESLHLFYFWLLGGRRSIPFFLFFYLSDEAFQGVGCLRAFHEMVCL
jgi:hypothetical protein